MFEFILTPGSLVINFLLISFLVSKYVSDLRKRRTKIYYYQNLIALTGLNDQELREKLFFSSSWGDHRLRGRVISEIVAGFDGDEEKEEKFHTALKMIDGKSYYFSPTEDVFDLTHISFLIIIILVFSLAANYSYSVLVQECSDFFDYGYKYEDYTYEHFEECIYEFQGDRYHSKDY
jgi:hypothetical protein